MPRPRPRDHKLRAYRRVTLNLYTEDVLTLRRHFKRSWGDVHDAIRNNVHKMAERYRLLEEMTDADERASGE